MMHTKIAIIDSERRCCVYDAIGSQLLFIEENVDQFVWNERCDDLIVFSDGEEVSFKLSDLQRISTKYKGQLVHFSGLTFYAIRGTSLSQSDVSLSLDITALSRNMDYVRAYELSSFGLTEEGWNELAEGALRVRELQIAIKAAAHARNLKLLHFIEQIALLVRDPKFTAERLTAEADAWAGSFDSAARAWNRMGDSERAVQMFFDLRQFDRLKQFLSGDRMRRFALQQAESFEAMADFALAADLYLLAGESLRAIRLLAENRRIGSLAALAKRIEPSDSAALREAGSLLIQCGMTKEGMDLLAQLDDVSSLAKVRVMMKDWDEALSLARMHPALLPEVFLPFARHLYEDDQYFESLVSFFIAGQTGEAVRALNALLDNAITMQRHEEASFFLYGRSLGLASQVEDADGALALVESGLQLARAYSAFGRLKENMSSPFSVGETGALFYLSRFVVAYLNSIRRGEFKAKSLHGITEKLIGGLSFPEALFSLLSEAEGVGEFRLMKWCAEQLALFVVPPAVQEIVDFSILRTVDMKDGDDTECCERCRNRLFSSAEGPLLWCSECKCPIVFSSHSFRVLPVIPVKINGVNVDDVKHFLKTDPPVEGPDIDIADLLERGVGVDANDGMPVLTPDTFRKIEPTSIIICEWKKASKVPPTYLINPSLESVHHCLGCNSLFDDVDFELTFLETGRCPICKTPLDSEGEGEFADTYDSYSDLLRQLRDFATEIPIHF
jgi:intraflagellar transport protein 122